MSISATRLAHLTPSDRAIFATNARLISCLVTESLLKALYIPIVGFKINGIAVVLLGEFDAPPRPYQSKDILAIVALQDIPFLDKESEGSYERKIGLLDPLDMVPFIFEVSRGFSGPASEHDDLSAAILNTLCQQGWDIEGSTCLQPCKNATSIWEKFGSSLNLDKSLVQSISTEFSSSVKWQTHAYENPPPAPQFSSSSIAWEQSIVEGHPTHPVRKPSFPRGRD
ncbi:hypothetical protein C0993_007549 [Termitomyces sp. T159_Od127]|nr:hypothetical protein C0993_007549 [Termitomyces sp. T159_Od127]